MNSSISLAGLALIQEFEGFRADPGALPDGNWVVGYGHVRHRDPGAKVSQGDAVDLLARDLVPVIQTVNKEVTTPLTQSQFDALVSFAFSIGAEPFAKSQVLRRVNQGTFLAAGCAMEAWRKADVNGDLVVSEALVRRRAAEKALFLKELPIEAAPSALLRPQLDYAAAVLGAPIEFTETPKLEIAIATPVIDLEAIEAKVSAEAAAVDALRAAQAEAEAQARAKVEAEAQARAKAEAEAAAEAQAIAFADAQL
ncbi:MAG TPA: lysozyme, partial [Verrucomicrobiae bacterium]|nr:lysozyme [Verrucomicrobiae bacterium]